jgi:hypothetical protein
MNSKKVTQDLKIPQVSSDSEKKHNFTMSHLSIIRMFVIWGILDSIIYIYIKDDRYKALIIYLILFFIITSMAYIFPDIINFL